MLLQFSVRNFRVFKEKAILSLIASNYDKETREKENVATIPGYDLRVVKSAVIYGANASGKTKLIEAFNFMRQFTINSSKDSQKGDAISVDPFRLNAESENQPSEFEVIFIYQDILYRYGFEVDRNRVVSEWLFHKPKTKEVELFYRDRQDFDTHARSFSKGRFAVREGLIRENSLLLSLAAQLNDSTAINVIQWFKDLKIISGLQEVGYEGYTLSRTQDAVNKQKILELLQAADLGIQDITLEFLDVEQLPTEMPKEVKEMILRKTKEEKTAFISDMLTSHKKYDGSRKYIGDVGLSLQEDESFGTRKFFALSGPILDSLENGYTLVADELDSKLHPNLVCRLVALFNSQRSNPKNAQLIFNTHDTNLLSSEVFRKDQVWFTEKDKYGEAKLYSLSDFKTDLVRKNEAFEDNYIRGKYGAVPFLGFFDDFNLKNSAKNEGQETGSKGIKTKAKRSTKSQSSSGAIVRSARSKSKSKANHIDRL